MTEKDHWIALEAGPYFWNADTIYKFLKATYDVVKPAVESIRSAELKALGVKFQRKKPIRTSVPVQTPEDSKLIDFVIQLSGESNKVFCGKKWVDLMGTQFFDILKCNEDKVDIMKIDNDENKKACVVQLLRLIRNKMEHLKKYPDAVKQKLPMFFGGGKELTKLTLDERFVSYWITKFPRLVSFLWVKFYEFRYDLKSYYPVQSGSIDNDFSLMPIDEPSDLNVDLHDVMTCLDRALSLHLEKGAILKRFKLNEGPCSLEFRAIHGLTQILDKSSFISVQIIPDDHLRFVLSHSTTQQKLKYVSTEYPLKEKLTLIFADNIVNAEIWNACIHSDCQVLVFGRENNMNEENILKAVNNFKAKNSDVELAENQITWHELTKIKRNSIFENGQVCIQSKHVKINDIFSEYTANKVCSTFDGDFLKHLLRKEKPKLFDKYEFPTVDQVYIERSLYINGYLRVNKDIIFRDKYAARKIELIKSKMWVGLGFTHFAENFPPNLNEGYVNSTMFHGIVSFDEESTSLPETLARNSELLYKPTREEHHMRVDENDQFYYRVTKFINVARLQYFSEGIEPTFLRNVDFENQKPFFIMAEPGGGKSQLLKSLGRKMIENQECGLVIFIQFAKFVNQLKTELNKDKKFRLQSSIAIIKLAIEENLEESHQNFEKYFLSEWLDQENIKSKSGIINLLLDGLDEVQTSSMSLAVETLVIIQNEIKSIRLWVTSRHPFSRENSAFKYDTVQMLPFTEEEQKGFFVKYFEKNKPNCNAEEFAIKCSRCIKGEIENQLETYIAINPLHCHMLAELFEETMTSSVELEKHDLTLTKISLYEGLLKKKIQVYMREKLDITMQVKRTVFQIIQDCLFELHTYLALELLCPGTFIKPINASRFTESDYLDMGIVYSLEPLTFVHKTFAEYLVAQFIYQELTSEFDSANRLNSNSMCELLVEVFSCSIDSIDFKHNVTCKFLNEMLNRCTLHHMAFLKTHSMQHPNLEMIIDLFNKDIYQNYANVFMLVVRLWSGSFNEQYFTKAFVAALTKMESQFPLDAFIELCDVFGLTVKGMNITNNSDYQIFESILKNGHYEIAKYVIQDMGWFPMRSWSNISNMRKDGGGILHIVLHSDMCRLYKYGYTWNQKERIYRLLKLINDVAKSQLRSETIEMANQVDNNGYTALMTLPLFARNYYVDIREFLVEKLGADVNAILPDGRSALCLLSFSDLGLNHNSFGTENYHNTLELFINNGFFRVNSENEKGWTALACAVHVFGSKLQVKTLKLFQKAKFDFNAKDKRGRTILHYCVESVKNAGFVVPLVILGCDISIEKKNGQDSFCLAVDLQKSDMCKVLRIMMNLKKKGERETDQTNYELFKYGSLEIFELLEEFGYVI